MKTTAMIAAEAAGLDFTGDTTVDELLYLFNEMYYARPRPTQEAQLIRHVLTRVASQRSGLHVTNLISEGCDRYLWFARRGRPKKSAPHPKDYRLERIFEFGNSVHLQFQRLFLRAGYAEVQDLDSAVHNTKYKVNFAPDAICTFPGIGRCIVEIKSVNTKQFSTMRRHPTAYKQVLLYCWLLKEEQGVVLSQDKNTQELNVEFYRLKENKDIIQPYIDRLKIINSPKLPPLYDGKCGECEYKEVCDAAGTGITA